MIQHRTWSINSDLSSNKTKCEIREMYKSSEVVLTHQSNIREPSGALFEKFGLPSS